MMIPRPLRPSVPLPRTLTWTRCLAVGALLTTGALALALPRQRAAGQTPPPATAEPTPSGTAQPGHGLPTNPHAAVGEVHLPVLGVLASATEVCDTVIVVQNAGSDHSKAVLVAWGDIIGCVGADCAGPLKVECTGLLRPGSTWNMIGAQIPAGSQAGILFSFTARKLSEIGVDLGFDDVVADYMCQTLFFGIVGDCGEYRAFKKAYSEGGAYAGVPMDKAYGAPLAVEVRRQCGTVDRPMTSSYGGISGKELGAFDPVLGGFGYYLPYLTEDEFGAKSSINIQNAGWECASVDGWFAPEGECNPERVCAFDPFTLAPGESKRLPSCLRTGSGGTGAAWLRSTEPMAVTVDIIRDNTLSTYIGQAGHPQSVEPGQAASNAGGTVLFGPLIYHEYETRLNQPGSGWYTLVHVQNESTTTEARVKVYFQDRSGDIITTLVDTICPRGSQTFDLAVVADLPGSWVGSVRVESQEWWSPSNPPQEPPRLTGIVELIGRQDSSKVSEALAYNMLDVDPYHRDATHSSAESTGSGLVAIPDLRKDLDSSGVTSQLAIANLVPKPGFTDFALFIYDQNGLLDYICNKLNEKQVEYIDLKTWGYVNSGFKGSAIISATLWEHDVFDPAGNLIANLVDLGAVVVERPCYRVGSPFQPACDADKPGDASVGSTGIGFTSVDGAAVTLFPPFLPPLCPGRPTPSRPTRTPLPTPTSPPTPTGPRVTPTDTPVGPPGTPASATPTVEFPRVTPSSFPPTATPRGRYRLWLPSLSRGAPEGQPPGQPTDEPQPPRTTPPAGPTPTTVPPRGTPTEQPTPGPTPLPSPPANYAPPVHLPVLNFQRQDEICRSWITVQSTGSEPSKAILITFSMPGFCPPQCDGPLKVECSGLIPAGSSWSFLGAQMPQGSRGGILVSYTARMLSEIGVDLGFDDVVADLMCETLFFGITGDCDDYRRFMRAYQAGDVFAGIPQSRAYGAPLIATVRRDCPGDVTPGVMTSAAYEGIPATELGVINPETGKYDYPLPLLYAGDHGLTSTVYIQNAGLSCAEIQLWFRPAADLCTDARLCYVLTLAPGETEQFYVSDCWSGSNGSGFVRGSEPLAVVVDTVGDDVMTTFVAPPYLVADGSGPRRVNGRPVASGPLFFRGDGWDTAIAVQNLSQTETTYVQVELYDADGRSLGIMNTWICPMESETLNSYLFGHVSSNVGSFTVTSKAWEPVRGRRVEPQPISAVAELVQWADPDRTHARQAVAYNASPAAGATIAEGGPGLLAVPSIVQDPAGSGVTTDLAITNLNASIGQTEVALYLVDEKGAMGTGCLTLAEREVGYIDLDSWSALAPGFKGGAFVSAVSWHRRSGGAWSYPPSLGVAAVQDLATGTGGPESPGDEASTTTGVALAPSAGALLPFPHACPPLPSAPRATATLGAR